MKKFVLILLSAILPFTFACCKGNSEKSEEISGEYFTLTADGTLLCIRLPGNYTTGFTWEGDNPDENSLSVVKSEYITDENKDYTAGAGGTFTVSYKSVPGKEANLTVKYDYLRTFENRIPLKTYTLELDVSKSGEITVINEEMKENY